jgi:isopentenyldiphosphate isomerase
MSDPSQELVDVIDDAGQTVGTVTRQEMRARRLPHRSVYILVFNKRNELFVHLRTPTKDVFPSYWDVAVGGVLAAGESFEDGARREGREELGVDLKVVSLFPFRYQDATTVLQAVVYGAQHDGPFSLQPEEIVRGEFVSMADLNSIIAHAQFCPDGLAVLTEYQRRRMSFIG